MNGICNWPEDAEPDAIDQEIMQEVKESQARHDRRRMEEKA